MTMITVYLYGHKLLFTGHTTTVGIGASSPRYNCSLRSNSIGSCEAASIRFSLPRLGDKHSSQARRLVYRLRRSIPRGNSKIVKPEYYRIRAKLFFVPPRGIEPRIEA